MHQKRRRTSISEIINQVIQPFRVESRDEIEEFTEGQILESENGIYFVHFWAESSPEIAIVLENSSNFVLLTK